MGKLGTILSLEQPLMTLECILFICLTTSPLVGCTSLRNLQTIPCNYTLQTCGSLAIPYPFGMSDECGLPDYRIQCKRNVSYGDGDLAFLQIGTPNTSELQVLSFSTDTLIVNSTHLKAMPSKDDCGSPDVYGKAVLELSMNGPFILSGDNWFVVVGCQSMGNCQAETVLAEKHNFNISCTTACYNQYEMAFCNYYACCVNALPPGSRSLDFRGRGISYKDFPDVCGFSTVLMPDTFTISPDEKGLFAAGHYGLSISWALLLPDQVQNCSVAIQEPDYACHKNAECIDNGIIHGYTCNCTEGYRGDGYIAGTGCQEDNNGWFSGGAV